MVIVVIQNAMEAHLRLASLVSFVMVRSTTMRLGLRSVPAIGGGRIWKAAFVMYSLSAPSSVLPNATEDGPSRFGPSGYVKPFKSTCVKESSPSVGSRRTMTPYGSVLQMIMPFSSKFYRDKNTAHEGNAKC